MNGRIRELDIFLRVSETQNFSLTARNLDVDPSTISKVIQRLEDRLGVRLFHRTPRALTLTQEGERFLHGAQRVIATLEDADRSFARCRSQALGTLRVNSTPAFSRNRLAPLMPEFAALHPGVKVEFMLTANVPDILEQQIDVSIQSGPIADSTLMAKRVATARWLLCASPSYLAAAGTPATAQDLAGHNCLNFMPGSFRSRWPLAGCERPFEAKGNMLANNGDMLCALARAGMGIARLADYHAQDDLDNGRLVALAEALAPSPPEPLYAVYAGKRHLSARVQVFLDFLAEKLAAA